MAWAAVEGVWPLPFEGLCKRATLVGTLRTSPSNCVEVDVVLEWRGGNYYRSPRREREVSRASTKTWCTQREGEFEG